MLRPTYLKFAASLAFAFCSLLGFSQEYTLQNSSSTTVSGTSTLHDWTVDVKNQTGKVSIAAKKIMEDAIKAGSITNLSVTVFASDIMSRKGKTMDNKMHKALKMELFPTITYTLNNPVGFELINKDGHVLENFSGILSIAGVERTVSTTVRAHYNNKKLSLSGELPIKLSDFNIEPPTAMFGQIETGNDIIVNFNLDFSDQ